MSKLKSLLLIASAHFAANQKNDLNLDIYKKISEFCDCRTFYNLSMTSKTLSEITRDVPHSNARFPDLPIEKVSFFLRSNKLSLNELSPTVIVSLARHFNQNDLIKSAFENSTLSGVHKLISEALEDQVDFNSDDMRKHIDDLHSIDPRLILEILKDVYLHLNHHDNTRHFVLSPLRDFLDEKLTIDFLSLVLNNLLSTPEFDMEQVRIFLHFCVEEPVHSISKLDPVKIDNLLQNLYRFATENQTTDDRLYSLLKYMDYSFLIGRIEQYSNDMIQRNSVNEEYVLTRILILADRNRIVSFDDTQLRIIRNFLNTEKATNALLNLYYNHPSCEKICTFAEQVKVNMEISKIEIPGVIDSILQLSKYPCSDHDQEDQEYEQDEYDHWSDEQSEGVTKLKNRISQNRIRNKLGLGKNKEFEERRRAK